MREYVPQVYDGHVTLFWASSDLRASVDFVEGWRALAGGGIEVHEIPGKPLGYRERTACAGAGEEIEWLFDESSGDRASGAVDRAHQRNDLLQTH